MNDNLPALDLQRTDSIPKGDLAATGLRLNFHDAPLYAVLNYLQERAGVTIRVAPNVEVGRPIDLWQENLVDKEDALQLLRLALNTEGYTAVCRPGTVAVITAEEAKKHCIPLPKIEYSTAF